MKDQDLIERPRHAKTVAVEPKAGGGPFARAGTPELLERIHETPRTTRRPQSPCQQSAVHSVRFPTMSDTPAAFEP